MSARPQPAPDLEGEQELDLASAWERIKLRWWLPLLGVLAGGLAGIVLALSGGDVWRADTIVYLGQPFAPLGGGQIQSLATNPRTVGEIVRSEAVLRDVSENTGIPVSRLRASISTQELTATGPVRAGVVPLIEISVKGDAGPRRTEDAANALAERVVSGVSSYVELKLADLRRRVEIAEAQLAAIDARIQTAQRQLAQVLANDTLSFGERLLFSANLNSTITTSDARRATLQGILFDANQLRILAEEVEQSRVVEQAAAVKTTARSSGSSLLVGALIGLVVGLVAALAAEPILARRRPASSEG